MKVAGIKPIPHGSGIYPVGFGYFVAGGKIRKTLITLTRYTAPVRSGLDTGATETTTVQTVVRQA